MVNHFAGRSNSHRLVGPLGHQNDIICMIILFPVMSSFKQSEITAEKNKDVWLKNLIQFQSPTKERNVAVMEEPLSELTGMPLKSQVIGRFKSLESAAKERKGRVRLISEELKALWSTALSFPQLSDQTIQAKLERLLRDYDYCRKKQKFDSLNELFDVTKVKALSKSDEKLYKCQIRQSQISNNIILPPKRRKMLPETNNEHPGCRLSD